MDIYSTSQGRNISFKKNLPFSHFKLLWYKNNGCIYKKNVHVRNLQICCLFYLVLKFLRKKLRGLALVIPIGVQDIIAWGRLATTHHQISSKVDSQWQGSWWDKSLVSLALTSESPGIVVSWHDGMFPVVTRCWVVQTHLKELTATLGNAGVHKMVTRLQKQLHDMFCWGLEVLCRGSGFPSKHGSP